MAATKHKRRRRRPAVAGADNGANRLSFFDMSERLETLQARLDAAESRHAEEVARLQRKISQLEETVAAKDRRITDLEAELAKARKTSRNSSKPPSSDITRPAGKKSSSSQDAAGTERRARGGQPGHPRHVRPAFDLNEIDITKPYVPETCPCCGAALTEMASPTAPRTLTQVELPERPVVITKHECHTRWCGSCRKPVTAVFPPGLIEAGLIGPRLTALVGFLRGACGMTISAMRRHFRDVLRVKVSKGFLAKLLNKVSGALDDAYEELLRQLPLESVLNVDETGHKDSGRRFWTWAFRAATFAVFKISPSRGSEVLLEVLGREFDGLLGCDYFSAYRKYMRLNENVRLQFCLAHFIRDVKFLAEHPDAKNRAYGTGLLALLKKLFAVIHRREEYPTEAGFRNAVARVRNELVWAATMESPHTREARALEERFYQHTESYFRFITDPDLDPTNNIAEQTLRFIAVLRRITQGTRSPTGRTASERLWSILATCTIQGRSAFDYLVSAVTAHFAHQPVPTLLPDPISSG